MKWGVRHFLFPEEFSISDFALSLSVISLLRCNEIPGSQSSHSGILCFDSFIVSRIDEEGIVTVTQCSSISKSKMLM